MKIAVVGTGAVGGYFGGRLAAAGDDVAFLARGRHLDALRRDGLSIASPGGDLRLSRINATDRPAEIGPVDIVLFAVKLYDAESAAAALAPLIGRDTAVITVQNGVDAVETVSRHVGREHVVGGAAYIIATVEAPGRIRHTAKDTLLFGERDGSRSRRLAAFEAAARRAGFGATLSANIELDLWTKFVRLATWSGLTTVARSPIGVLREDPALMAMMSSVLDEAIAVGRARGVPLPDSLPEETMSLVKSFPDGSKSSMLEDLEHGRRLELPWLSGAIARMGREAGVPTPIHRFIATVLAPFVAGRGGSDGGHDAS
jgi:2-dehydropantoate 2-reductase